MLKVIRSKARAKLQWLQDPSENNGDNMNNVRHEACSNFRNKRGNICKAGLMHLQQAVRTRPTERDK
jgi:hypothetical protein